MVTAWQQTRRYNAAGRAWGDPCRRTSRRTSRPSRRGEVERVSKLSRYQLSHHLKTMLDDQPGELFAVNQFDWDTLVLFVAFRLSNRLRAKVPRRALSEESRKD